MYSSFKAFNKLKLNNTKIYRDKLKSVYVEQLKYPIHSRSNFIKTYSEECLVELKSNNDKLLDEYPEFKKYKGPVHFDKYRFNIDFVEVIFTKYKNFLDIKKFKENHVNNYIDVEEIENEFFKQYVEIMLKGEKNVGIMDGTHIHCLPCEIIKDFLKKHSLYELVSKYPKFSDWPTHEEYKNCHDARKEFEYAYLSND
jgi:hypothetical protein